MTTDKAGLTALAEQIEAAANSGNRYNNEVTGQIVRNHLPTILASLRAIASKEPTNG